MKEGESRRSPVSQTHGDVPTAREKPQADRKIAEARIAASWRFRAERSLADRTGGPLLLH